MLYYFFGSVEYGKSKIGLYPQSRFRVQVNEDKATPTAQVIKDGQGNFKEVRIEMTSRELAASAGCFAEK